MLAAGLALLAGVFLDRAALSIGLLAGATAIGAFLGRSYAAFGRRDEPEIQIETAIGGLRSADWLAFLPPRW